MIPENLDVLVVLGGRIGIPTFDTTMALSPHMEIRAESALAYYRKNKNTKLIISGGKCFGIRYPLKLSDPAIQPANVSPKAVYSASLLPSESTTISLWLNSRPFGVPFESMFLEQSSTTTDGNAKQSAIIAAHLGAKKIGILSMAYHLLRPEDSAMNLFNNRFLRNRLPPPIPVFTEEILCAFQGFKAWEAIIWDFYQTPKSRGFLWPADEICRRLQKGESLIGIEPTRVRR